VELCFSVRSEANLRRNLHEKKVLRKIEVEKTMFLTDLGSRKIIGISSGAWIGGFSD
jgi:hypothetical protein